MDSSPLPNVLTPTFTRSEARRWRIPDHVIYRWRDEGLIFELSRGVFRRADSPETAHLDVIAVCKRVPRGVVCLISALAIHELTDEIPLAVQLAVRRGTALPRIDYPPTEISRFDAQSFDVGVENFEASSGEFVPIYNAARSVVDVMRLRHLIGDTVAYSALQAYLARKRNPGELSRYADQLGVTGPIRRTLQVVLSR